MKTIRTALSAGFLALALTACGLSPEERLERASEAFAENRFSEARLDLASVLQGDAGNVAALELLARTQLQLGDGEGAAATLERLVAAGRSPDDLPTLLAEAELLRRNFEGALAVASELRSAEGARIMALAQIGLGDEEAAGESFAAGLGLPGERSRLLADYALYALGTGDPERAVQLAADARAADAEGLDPLVASARIAQAGGEYAAALGFYEQAVQHWPESRAALLGRVGMLGDMGRMDEARPLIEELATQTPDDPDVVYLLARLSAEEGDWQEVRQQLQPLENREDSRLQLLYSRALLELDLPEQALPRLTTLLRRAPHSLAARRLLAQAQLDAGDAGDAFTTIQPLAVSAHASARDLALFAEVARASGRSADLGAAQSAELSAERLAHLLARADAAMADGNWRGAIDAYEDLREWTGNSNAMVLNNLAYARGQAGEADAAIELAEQALALAPRNASIMDTLGWLLVSSGNDSERGVALLEEAAALAPDNAAIRRHLETARQS
ncbi:MAG: tetratricopeptide repeat protein [Erythrobacter sp.]|nr:MAG: tetratricopeptide repeat protein [Erythrobacter sp.]